MECQPRVSIVGSRSVPEVKFARMIEQLQNILRGQYGGSLKMLENAVGVCPDDLWLENAGATPFWHVAFHTLFFADLYVSGSLDGFAPPEPFGMTEIDPKGTLPDRPYTKAKIIVYISHCREKVSNIVPSIDENKDAASADFAWLRCSFLELQFYNIRHIQHHVGQLNLILRQQLDYHAPWVGRVD